MARARLTSDASNIRIFRAESGSGLAKLANIGFGDEGQLHRLIEGNIEELFPGLTFLGREFRQLDGGRHIPDTVAFDVNQNTFSVIEYKNKLDRGVIDQAKAYLKYVKKNKHALVMEFIKSGGKGQMELKSYNWDVYAIIMAPEFSRNQLDSAEDDGSLELYEIKRYDADVLTVRRAGGGHERTLAETTVPGLVAKAPQTQAAAHTSNHVSTTTQTNHLYDAIRARLLHAFPGAEETKKKFYNGFRYPGDQYFCTISLQKSKIWLAYSGKRAASELRPDGFVRNVDGWGVGKLRSEIKSEDDFEKALSILEELHTVDRSESAQPVSSAQQSSGKRVFPDELFNRVLLPKHVRRQIRAVIFAVRPSFVEGDRTVLTYGGIDTENHILIVNQEIVSDSFPEIVETVTQKQRQMEYAEFRGAVVVPVDATGVGASLLAVLRAGDISGCVEFRLTDGRMDAAYIHLRTELETGRVFVQEPKYPYKDELYAQLRGIVQDRDGTIRASKGSDRAASLAIAVWSARNADNKTEPGTGL